MTLEELSDLNDEYQTITIRLDEDGDPYIAPHVYGNVYVSASQCVRMLTTLTAKGLGREIETLQEILDFKIKFPYS